MEVFEIRNLSFSYPEQEQLALQQVNLTVYSGEFIVVCGPSGCGKSTLLRHLKPTLTPHGTRCGEIQFYHQKLETLDQRSQAQRIGYVQQSPDAQLVTDKVWHELAFGLESLGYEAAIIRRRVAELASFFGIQEWFDRDVAELSGGQKQLLNLAAVMTMRPDVLILDEPVSQLDPIAAASFLEALGKINRELGTVVILTGHRLEDIFALANRVVVMERGKIAWDGPPAEAGHALTGCAMYHALPTAMRVWGAVERQTEKGSPVTVRDGRKWLEQYAAQHTLLPIKQEEVQAKDSEIVISAKSLWFRYGQNTPDVIKGLSISVRKGEFLALLGGNGTGKTSTLKLLAGLRKPLRGAVEIRGRIGLLPQEPKTLFVKKSVREELLSGFEDGGYSTQERLRRTEDAARLFRLEEVLERHPYDLSGGEQQRVALARVMLMEPDILLMDEPTKGLDVDFRRELARNLKQLLNRGITIVMVSHDIEFCAEYAHRCALLFDGDIVAEGSPRAFFSDNHFYTTAANRMAGNLLQGAVTAADIIAACGGAEPCQHVQVPKEAAEVELPRPLEKAVYQTEQKIAPRRHRWGNATLMGLIPLTLLIGIQVFGTRQYYLLALIVLLECMLPFFLSFEGRRPQARELVMIAVLCAIGVAGRAAFYMFPNFKPVMALTIIAGIALGSESGFLVGAVTMLTSNMIFSQGPWTPWQMFCMGVVGALAGKVFAKGGVPRSKWKLAAFGAVSAVLIYGGIMNFASALMWANTLNWKIIASYYISGFPLDCIHAAATVTFLLLTAQPLLEKLERIKQKYGWTESKEHDGERGYT